MVNQSFNAFGRRTRPGRKGRKPLLPGNIFPVGKQSLTIRDLASRRASRARDMHFAPGQRRMAKAKKAEEEKEAPDAEGEGEAAPKTGMLSKKLIIMAAAGLLVLGSGG